MSSGSSTQQQTISPEERELTRIQAELAQKQSTLFDQMQPFQQELLNQSLAEMKRQSAMSDAMDAAVTPEQQAALYKQDYDRSVKLGPIQDELLQLQLDEARRGGAATPEQLQRIKEAADAGIEAGTSDIDMSTKRGIGLISDELANSRGLRLSDSPIGSEAALLARGGEDQKASLIKNLRAGQASAALNYPLAASQVTSGINLNQQQVLDAAKTFQADLRQRAFQNRMALTGQTEQSGIGLSSIRTPGATGVGSSTSGRTSGVDIGTIGKAAGGIGMAMLAFSDERLKDNIVKVGDDDRGIGIYEYNKFGRRKRGVMADEVERISPSAVSIHPSGFKVVDYRKI